MSASSESERMPQRQLGELMTELGLISQEQLATVLEVQQQSKRPLGQIIVELGFASGAAVAHALAMQSGGALRTEYGFALGVPPKDEQPDAEGTRTDLPKLRLAPTAVAPATRPDTEPTDDAPTDVSVEPEAVEEPSSVAAVPLETEPEEVEKASEVDEVEEVAEAVETTVEEPETAPEETVHTEPDETPDEAEPSAEVPPAVDVDPTELEQLRSEVERLEAVLSEAQAAADEQDRLLTEV